MHYFVQFSRCDLRLKPEFNIHFYEHLKEGSGGKSFFEDSSFLFLTIEERRLVEDYFLVLGKGDSVAQKGYFTSFKDRLSDLQNNTETLSKRYGDLYIKIGFLCGLLLLLLII